MDSLYQKGIYFKRDFPRTISSWYFLFNFPCGLLETVLCTMTSFMISCNVKSECKMSKPQKCLKYPVTIWICTCPPVLLLDRLYSSSSNACFSSLPILWGYKLKTRNRSISSKLECKLGENIILFGQILYGKVHICVDCFKSVSQF